MKRILDDLVFKARLQRDVHAYWEERCKAAASRYKVAILLLSGLLTFLSFTKLDIITMFLPLLTPTVISVSLALLSLAIFVLTVCIDMFSLTTKHVEHRSAMNRYTALLRDIYLADIKTVDSPEAKKLVAELEKRYRDLSTSVIPLTRSEFDRGEHEYYKREALRRHSRSYPFAWHIFRRLAVWLKKDTE
jgi:hypothetical protein